MQTEKLRKAGAPKRHLWLVLVAAVLPNLVANLDAQDRRELVLEGFMQMVAVPAGRFQRDGTATNISAVSAFRIGRTEVTREQFLTIMGNDPSDPRYSSGLSDPVQNVNWYEAIAFSNKLSLAEGLTPVYSVSGVNFATLTCGDS